MILTGETASVETVESEETTPVEELTTPINTFDPSGQYQRWSVGTPSTNSNIEKSGTDYITPGGEYISPDEYVEPGTYTVTFTGFDPYMSVYHAPNFSSEGKTEVKEGETITLEEGDYIFVPTGCELTLIQE